MQPNIILFSWTRSIPGRETLSASHFNDFVQYLGSLQQQGTITSFDTVFLTGNGANMNGFFLIKGAASQLDALTSSDEWTQHMIRASLHLENVGVNRGSTGEAVMARMQYWTQSIPELLPA